MGRGTPRAASIRLWLRRRGFRAEAHNSRVHFAGWVISVHANAGRLPGNITPAPWLDTLEEQNPGKRVGYIRATNRDPAKCLVTVRLDDLIAYINAVTEMELRNATTAHHHRGRSGSRP